MNKLLETPKPTNRAFRRLVWVCVVILLLAVVAELVLRVAFGLGNPALVQTDPEIGYFFKPDQDIVRFGKRMCYNHFSQRSDPVEATRPAGTLRVLMVGDSVLNGGNPVDQSETISELLRARLKAAGTKTEVLAASAGGWALDNRLAYLRRFGVCDSNLVILEIGTNDLLQPFAPSAVVDRDENFPSRRPVLAIGDAWLRYAWPLYLRPLLVKAWPAKFPPVTPPAAEQSSPDYYPHNLETVRQFIEEARKRGCPCWVLYIPDQTDLSPRPPSGLYERDLMTFLESARIPTVDLLPVWTGPHRVATTGFFRDEMHLTAAGDRAVADTLAPVLLQAAKDGSIAGKKTR